MFRLNPRPDPQRTDALAAAGGPAGRPGLLRGDAHPQGRGHRGLLRRTDHHRNTRKGEIISRSFNGWCEPNIEQLYIWTWFFAGRQVFARPDIIFFSHKKPDASLHYAGMSIFKNILQKFSTYLQFTEKIFSVKKTIC